MHGAGRCKSQIENEHQCGPSVSHNRVMEVKKTIAQAVCNRQAEDGAVLPTVLRCNVGLFTIYDVDNLDSNRQGNFPQDELHGTAISATNHLSHDNLGVKRSPIELDFTDTSTPKLLESYSVVQPVRIPNSLIVPKSDTNALRPGQNLLKGAAMKDESWLHHVGSVVQEDTLSEDEVIMWSGYNSK